MDEHISSPIDQLAYLLGSMTARALEAERQRDAAKMDAENWYQAYTRKDTQLEECRKLLEVETEECKRLRAIIESYMPELLRGGAENDADE